MSDEEVTDDEVTDDEEFEEGESNILELDGDFQEWKPGQDPVSRDQWNDWAKRFDYGDFSDLKGQGYDLQVNWGKREVHLVDLQ